MNYETDLDAPLLVLEKDFVPGLCFLHNNGDVAIVIGVVRIMPSPLVSDRVKNMRVYHVDMILFSPRHKRTIFTYGDFVFDFPRHIMGLTVKKVLFAK